MNQTRHAGKPQSLFAQPNLVTSWRQLKTKNNKPLRDSLKKMNEDLQKCITNSRFTEWERGVKTPSHNIINYILQDVLNEKAEQFGLKGSERENFIQSLMLSEKSK